MESQAGLPLVTWETLRPRLDDSGEQVGQRRRKHPTRPARDGVRTVPKLGFCSGAGDAAVIAVDHSY